MQVAEQIRDLLMRSGIDLGWHSSVVGSRSCGDRAGGEIGRKVRDDDHTAGCQSTRQFRDDRGWIIGVGNELQQREKQYRDRPVEVERYGSLAEDISRLEYVAVDVLARSALAWTGQCSAVGQDDWVVVDMDDSAVRGQVLRNAER
jgi:hypothetical protein